MKDNRSKTAVAVVALIVSFLISALGAFAEEIFNANDLQPAQITAATKFDGFTIYANGDKAVTIEAIDVARTAADQEVFNVRIKLNGGGALDYRSIQFTAKGPGELTVYLNSSSKTDTRVLKVVDAAGTVLAELAAPPDVGGVAGMATFTIPKEGEYAVFSAGSGINIYQLVVR